MKRQTERKRGQQSDTYKQVDEDRGEGVDSDGIGGVHVKEEEDCREPLRGVGEEIWVLKHYHLHTQGHTQACTDTGTHTASCTQACKHTGARTQACTEPQTQGHTQRHVHRHMNTQGHTHRDTCKPCKVTHAGIYTQGHTMGEKDTL